MTITKHNPIINTSAKTGFLSLFFSIYVLILININVLKKLILIQYLILLFMLYEQRNFWNEKIKIRIVTCQSENYWYCNYVGELFTIDSLCVRDYYVNHEGNLKGILKKDCKIEL
jgi:hypothetical protein